MSVIKKLKRTLEKENSRMSFSVVSNELYSASEWIEYRKGDKYSINLPKGAEWIDDCRTIMYNGIKVKLIPMTEKVIG